MNYTSSSAAFLLIALFMMVPGCNRDPAAPPAEMTEPIIDEGQLTAEPRAPEPEAEAEESQAFVLNAEQLLANRLPAAQASEGWVRLFDGTTFFGLQMASQANWTVNDGVLSADSGEQGLICTNTRWLDYDLSLEYKASSETNSGIFLRTPLFPDVPGQDCYELNIAPADNPFPTGSLVQRKRLDPEKIGRLDDQAWHRYDIRVQGDTVTVQLDGKEILKYTDPNPLPAGMIGFQHNSGPIAFRDIRIKPLGLESLLSEKIQENWQRYPDMEGDYRMTEDGMHITGGRGQLESKAQFANFALLAEVRTNAADLNSGIFFRCIPGDLMMGYECQISNATKGGDPLFPADCGTGGIFRQQDARIVAADDKQWFSMLLVANGPTVASWVNGLQVCEWTDGRSPDPNPRKGLRLEAGTLMLQAHDPTTDIHMRKLAVVSLP